MQIFGIVKIVGMEMPEPIDACLALPDAQARLDQLREQALTLVEEEWAVKPCQCGNKLCDYNREHLFPLYRILEFTVNNVAF